MEAGPEHDVACHNKRAAARGPARAAAVGPDGRRHKSAADTSHSTEAQSRVRQRCGALGQPWVGFGSWVWHGEFFGLRFSPGVGLHCPHALDSVLLCVHGQDKTEALWRPC